MGTSEAAGLLLAVLLVEQNARASVAIAEGACERSAVRFAGDAVELLYNERVPSTNLGAPLTATDELV